MHRILLDGELLTEGAIEEVYNEFITGDSESGVEPQPDFDINRLTYHPDDLAEEASRQKQAALALIDQLHAQALVKLCGQATVEERDTWPVKLAAAQAVLSGGASDTQEQMLASEAEGKHVELQHLAEQVIFRAEMYQHVVGVAAKLRANAKRSLEGVEAANFSETLKAIQQQAQENIAEEALRMKELLKNKATTPENLAINDELKAEADDVTDSSD